MPEVYIRDLKVRTEIERALERLLGLRCAAEELQRRAAIVVCAGVVRLQAERSVQRRERLGGSAGIAEQKSQAVMNQRIAWSEHTRA